MLIGEDDQGVSLDQIGHQSAQRVVVTELDLVIDDGIVLVDHRDDLQAQQCQQRRASVQIALAVCEVRVGQQHLCAANAMLSQLGFVQLRQAHLADGRSGLQFVQRLGTRCPSQALHAFGDGSARHHHDLTALRCQRRQLPAPIADCVRIETTPLVGHQAGADLDDDPARRRQSVPHGMRLSGARKRGSGSSGTTFFSRATCS